MENLSLHELKILRVALQLMPIKMTGASKLMNKIKQAIVDKEFEEKTRPLNF